MNWELIRNIFDVGIPVSILVFMYITRNMKRDLQLAWKRDIEVIKMGMNKSDSRIHSRIDELSVDTTESIHNVDSRLKVLESRESITDRRLTELYEFLHKVDEKIDKRFDQMMQLFKRDED